MKSQRDCQTDSRLFAATTPHPTPQALHVSVARSKTSCRRMTCRAYRPYRGSRIGRTSNRRLSLPMPPIRQSSCGSVQSFRRDFLERPLCGGLGNIRCACFPCCICRGFGIMLAVKKMCDHFKEERIMAMPQRDDTILRRSTSYGGRVEEIKRLELPSRICFGLR